jgi:hypothetical protein
VGSLGAAEAASLKLTAEAGPEFSPVESDIPELLTAAGDGIDGRLGLSKDVGCSSAAPGVSAVAAPGCDVSETDASACILLLTAAGRGSARSVCLEVFVGSLVAAVSAAAADFSARSCRSSGRTYQHLRWVERSER